MDSAIVNGWLCSAVLVVLIVAALLIVRWASGQLSKRLSQQELDNLQAWTMMAVDAVEQLYQSGQLQKDERLRTALEFVQERFPKANWKEIKVIVEQYILSLKVEPLIIGSELDEPQ